MLLLLVFMQLTHDLFAIAKLLLRYAAYVYADKQTGRQTDSKVILPTLIYLSVVSCILLTVDLHYHRRHDRQLIPKVNKMYNSKFVVCMLYDYEQ